MRRESAGEHRRGVKESSMNKSQRQELMRCEELSLAGVESILEIKGGRGSSFWRASGRVDMCAGGCWKAQVPV